MGYDRHIFYLWLPSADLAVTWRLYDASAIPPTPLIAHGAGGREFKVVDTERWAVVRRHVEEG